MIEAPASTSEGNGGTAPQMGPEVTTPAPTGEAANNVVQDFQDWFLLHNLAGAKERSLTQGELNKKLQPKRVEQHLQMNRGQAGLRLENLKEQGFIKVEKKGRSTRYQLTDKGREHLATLQPHTAFLPKPAGVSEMPEEVVRYQQAYLLMQLLAEEDHRLKKTEANAGLTTTARRELELSPTAANFRRLELSQRNFIQVAKEGKNEVYRLTPDGRDFLGTLEHYPAAEFRIKGKVLNELLTAVREAQVNLHSTKPVSDPLPEDLGQAVLEEFHELLREKHSKEGIVPIHEVRLRLREKYGEQAGRHDVLDEALRQLRRDGVLKILPISDPQNVSQEQLNDSMQGVNETLFYLEAAHAQPVPG